jgi:hypothetical protein
VLSADQLPATLVASLTTKLLHGDLFGLEKVMPWGVRVYSMLVGDYQEKSLAIASVGDFAQAMGVRRKYREQIDQCLDEMLMNALYDAPVDGEGNQIFADVPVRERVLLKVNEKAVLQYACDGDRFAVSVRDSFGSLKRKTVLQYLDKCLHAVGGDQIDRKTGGAGLGLYLISNAATEVYFHIFDRSATEVVCCFDLTAPRSQLRSFGIFEELIETASRARPPTGPTRTISTRRGRRREDIAPPARPSTLLSVMMTFSVMLLLVAVGLASWPYLRQPTNAALLLESEPPGATLYLDGRKRGTAPLRVDHLEAGRSYAVRGTLAGHKDDDQLVTAAAGESTVRLHLASSPGEVAIESEPAGARLFLDGKDTGKQTPAALELEPLKGAEVTLRKDGFLEQKLMLTGPAAGERTVYRSTLPLSTEVASITIVSSLASATVTVDGLALMPPNALERQTFVKPDERHVVKVNAPGFIELREELTLRGGEHRTVRARLVEGGLLALKTNVSAKVMIDNKVVGSAPMGSLAVAEGKHTLSLRKDKPYLRFELPFEVEKGKTVEKAIEFGTVEVKAAGVLARPEGMADSKGVSELHLPSGPHKLSLVKDGEERDRDIVVEPGGKIVIDSW